MEQKNIPTEYTKLTKKCPVCREALYMETEYYIAGHEPNSEGEYVYTQHKPMYQVVCKKCGFRSPHYDTPGAIYDEWGTLPQGGCY